MEIWLDTANVDFVAHANELGILQGVTTNPTILSLSMLSLLDVIEGLLRAQKGLVAVQVLANDVNGMCEEARFLASISNRILVKIPVTQNGLRAMHALQPDVVPILATAIFEPHQALLAFKAGASYLAPYLGRIGDTGKDPIQVVSQMLLIKHNYGFTGKIMAAGIRELATVKACLDIGICAITLSDKIFSEFMQDCEPTLQALQKFTNDWSKGLLIPR